MALLRGECGRRDLSNQLIVFRHVVDQCVPALTAAQARPSGALKHIQSLRPVQFEHLPDNPAVQGQPIQSLIEGQTKDLRSAPVHKSRADDLLPVWLPSQGGHLK